MELRQLEYFVAVAEERNFTRAAARLHIVQSAVSAAVKGLEHELGARLLDRSARQVTLTDAGAEFLPHARTTLDAARDAREAVAAVRGGLRGNLHIGVMTSIRLVDVPALLGEYHRRHPDVTLHTSAAPTGSAGLVEAVTQRRLDAAFVSWPGPRPAGITFRDLAASVLDLVVPREHPLAGRRRVRIADLADLDFIDVPAGYGNRTVVDRAFAAAGVPRRVTIEIADVATGVDCVRHGLGVAFIPRFLLADADGVATMAVSGADLTWPLSLATAAGRAPGAAARALIDLIEEVLS